MLIFFGLRSLYDASVTEYYYMCICMAVYMHVCTCICVRVCAGTC